MKTEELIERFNKLKTERANFESLWQDIFDHYLPKRAPVVSNAIQGEKRGGKIYDSVPLNSLQHLAAVLQSMLTNPQSEWVQIETDNDDANERQNVKEWLDKLSDILSKSLENSNFYAQNHEQGLDLVSIGIGPMYIEEFRKIGKDLFFRAMHCRECYIQEGEQGETDLMFRCFEMTARQAMQRWQYSKITGKIPETIREAYEKEPTKYFEILHVVMPNDEYKKDSVNKTEMLYSSVWIAIEDEQEIDKGGYEEFPFSVPFWSKASGEDYGRSPAMDALADTKTLYAMCKTQLRVAEKIADPPLNLPDKGMMGGKADLRPGGLNYFRSGTQDRVEPIYIGAHFPITFEMIEAKRNQIRDTFLVTQLRLVDKKNMTAEEVRTITAENAKVLGPTFGRLCNGLSQLIERCLGILGRAGRLPEPPQEIQGSNFRFRYVSPLAKAQKMHEVQAISHTTETAILWADRSGRADVLDNLDFDKGIRKIADLDGCPSDFLVDEDSRDQVREERKQAMQEARQQEMQAMQAGTVKDQAMAMKTAQEAS